MHVPTTNQNLLDRLQRGSTGFGTSETNTQQTETYDWFLPGTNSNLKAIVAHANLDLQGASPESVADRVLSHIGE